ncbi:SH3 domain-containing protein [Pseudoalteromonas sp. MQS005]|uniref:SH3 domain-containing protein n=1 Tax=Pseudoalteromonas sp. MQS005 TaxID=1854052 RepID=UPI0012E8E65E|nr:SH3 domain-containing protein [Pseudoalteromonas sp. MQS005]
MTYQSLLMVKGITMLIRIILSIFLIFSTSCLSAEIELGINYVTIKKLNVRSSPSINGDIVSKKIFRQGVEVVELKNGWARIYFHDKNIQHWVSEKYLARKQPSATILESADHHFINELIPRTMSDKAIYYLLKVSKKEKTIVTIHKRVSSRSIGYSKTEINCKDSTYRSLGYTETNPEYFFSSKDKPRNWTKIINGSSKSDLVKFICNIRQYQ